MLLHLLTLLRCQRGGLEQHAVFDTDFTDVVQGEADPDQPNKRNGQLVSVLRMPPQRRCQSRRIDADPLQMIPGVGVARVSQFRQSEDDRVTRANQLLALAKSFRNGAGAFALSLVMKAREDHVRRYAKQGTRPRKRQTGDRRERSQKRRRPRLDRLTGAISNKVSTKHFERHRDGDERRRSRRQRAAAA